ncbi:MAG TPA: hypothetical protein IAB57_08355 [Candidatus Fimivivens faecavium]|nr:hypothetical protein [Candidatus Fimivivens faecavium]
MRRVMAVALVTVFLTAGIVFAADFIDAASDAPPTSLQDIAALADQAVTRRLLAVPGLRSIAPTVLLAGGMIEQNGVFITKEYLLEDIKPGPPEIMEENIAGIEAFLDSHNKPVYVMLIPTACAVKQDEIPQLAPLYNQKEMIGGVYERFAGRANLVDVYSELFAARDQYIYYRTESNLTGLGGYYIYLTLASRLGFNARPIDQFEVRHPVHDYYGDLYQRSNYKNVPADIITVYDYWKYDRQYQLTHIRDGEAKCYYTLFPYHLAALGEPMDVLLGGEAQRIDITAASPYEESFLIFADKTALSYLPFLTVHYGRITVIDLSGLTEEMFGEIDPNQYDQVLFAYSADSFVNRPVSAAAGKLQ